MATSEEHRRSVIRTKLARLQDPVLTAAISTGFGSLDAVLGEGGLPRGRIVECFGPAGCGKTTLALQMVAELQRTGGGAAWVDTEHVYDPAYAARLGVDVEKLPVAGPSNAEQAIEMACRLVASGAIELLVVDSAAAMVPRMELETRLGESGPFLQSRVLGSGLRRLALAARRIGCCVVFLNQKRFRPDAGPGETETSAGGPSLKLYAAVRLAFSPESGRLRIRALKNKASAAFRETLLEWRPGQGFAKSP